MAVPLIIPTIAAGAALAKGIGGAIQKSKAQKALEELGKTPAPEYGITPELQGAYQRAEAMSRYGFAPEEKAQFQSQLARQQSGARQSALDISGGGMGAAIGSVLQAQQTGAVTDFAAKGAGLRRENIRYADTLAGQIQSQQNLIQQQRISRRQMLEESYGKASAMGTEAMYGALGDVSNIAMASMGKGGIGKREIKPPSSLPPTDWTQYQ